MRNVSLGGACLLLPAPLTPGELLGLSLPGGDEGEASEILACVVRCDPVEADSWEVGCTFSSPLTANELHRFDPAASHNPDTDRRGWDRYPSHARAAYQIVRAPQSTKTQAAAIVDISGGGLALHSEQPLDVGDLLSVDLYVGDDHVVTALASVARTHRKAGRLVVGCNFIRELPEEQLARLLA